MVRVWWRRRWWLVGMVVVAGGVLAAWVLWPSRPEPRARMYRDFDVCLVTDSRGLAGTQAAAAWAGMQDVSARSRVRVSFLSVPGTPPSGQVEPYVAGLVQRRCRVVVAVGGAQVDAVGAVAGRYPSVRFVVVGGPAGGANVRGVTSTAADDIRVQVAAAVASSVPG